MDWARAPESREQSVLFPCRLDEAIAKTHSVRLLDEILHRIDWSEWEAGYALTKGQPPIHPQVMAGVILYGILKRVRSTRGLEEAIQVRLDFRWLVEGRTIDHTTISKFRRRHQEGLKSLFVQIGLIAREMGCLPLETLAFDGTRMRANNRRSGTRTPERLREMQKELARKFSEIEKKIDVADQEDSEVFGDESSHTLSQQLSDIEHRRKQVDAAIAELDRMEEAGEPIPKRLPTTDAHSRVTPNKDGGFAPNYTPLATVDVDSGFIVSADVISHTDESGHLIQAIEDVQKQFSLDSPPKEVLADGMMATGENLQECESRNITLYSPLPGKSDENPAIREDLTQPVSEKDRTQLPTIKYTRKEEKRQQISKEAFIYDEANDCYWCPEGKSLQYTGTTSEKSRKGKRLQRRRYKASEVDCSGCPLRDLCLRDKAKRRQINHGQYEKHRIAHAKRMATEEARAKYARRQHPGERPFAEIKHHFGARQFLLRGLKLVRHEWQWLATAFNLHRLMSQIESRAGPA